MSNIQKYLLNSFKSPRITAKYIVNVMEIRKNTVFPLVNMEMEAFEQTLSLQKDGDGGFCKNTCY